MATTLEAELLSVGELFDAAGTHYQIPIYQRNYAWGVEQIEQLIDDVWAALEADADSYFLGNLIVASPPTEGERYIITYEVIDGQQRLTTLFMLLAFLDVEPKAKLTYESRRAATDALSQLKESDDEDAAGIHAGFKAIESHMNRVTSNGDDLDRFKTFLREQVQLVRAALPGRTDLNRYFEIMNTRGQQLEQVDIVKARLMSYLGVEAERACFAWIWNACADMDSYVQMALTLGDTERRERIFGSGWDRIEIDAFEDLLPLRLGADSSSGGLEGNGAMSLQDAERHYARAAETPQEEDDEGRRRFESPIKFTSLLLHALKVLRGSDLDDDDEGQLDDGKLIKLFEDQFKPLTETEGSARAKEFAETLLRCKFVLDNHIIKREFTATNGEDGAWSLKRLTRAESRRGPSASYPNAFKPGQEEWDDTPIDDATREVLLLQSMLRITYTSPRTMHWITAVLRKPPLGLVPSEAAEAIHTILRDYARKKVQEALPGGELPTGFNIERVVFTYIDYLLARGAYSGLDADPDFVFVFRNSVEHFFPQWPDREQTGWDRVGDPEVHMFGNLALISVGANSKFNNNLPERKLAFERTIQQSTKLQLMAEMADPLRGGRVWDADAIRDHHEAMIELLRTDLSPGGPTSLAINLSPILKRSYPSTTSRSPTAEDAADDLITVCRLTSKYVSQHWGRSATDYEGASLRTGAPAYGLNYWEAWSWSQDPTAPCSDGWTGGPSAILLTPARRGPRSSSCLGYVPTRSLHLPRPTKIVSAPTCSRRV